MKIAPEKSGKFTRQLKESCLEVRAGYCWNKNCYNRVTEFHHLVPNTQTNRKLYPFFICSPINCFPICNDCHMNKALPVKPPELLIEIIEDYLRGLVDVS